MKRMFSLALIVTGLTAPAYALEVTNLDHVDHRVRFEAAGTAKEYEIPIDKTVYIAGQPNGRLSLITTKNPNPGKGVVQSDGLLSGIIGNGRNQGVPAETNDAFVIWENGEMGIQQRRRGGRMGN